MRVLGGNAIAFRVWSAISALGQNLACSHASLVKSGQIFNLSECQSPAF